MHIGSKTAALISVLLLWGMGADGQTLFSNRYTTDHYAAQFDALCLKDTTIIVSGVIADSIEPYFPIKNILGFFDDKGTLLKAKKFRGDLLLDYGTGYNNLIETHDGGYAVTAYTRDTSGEIKVLFMKFDSTGENQFVKEYADTTHTLTRGFNLEETANGFLIGGYMTKKPSPGNTDLQILSIDKLGNLNWWKFYGHSTLADLFPFFLNLTDTTYLVGYERNTAGLGTMWESSHTRFMVIDTSGKVLNEWQDSNDSTYAPYGLMGTKDGGFAYCGKFKYGQPYPYDYFKTQGVVTKLDTSYNILWKKKMGFPSSGTKFYQLKELPDNCFIAAGAHYSYNDSTFDYSGWFVKLSADGDSIWDRKYRSVDSVYDQTSEIYDFELLSDGGIIACGISTNYEASYQRQQGWLIRLDSMGCLIPGCDTMTAVGIKEESNELIGVKVYPNPAKDMVYVLMKADNEMKELSFNVYDMNGRLLNEVPYAGTDITYMLNTSSYASGTYFIEVRSKGKTIVQRKFVKQ